MLKKACTLLALSTMLFSCQENGGNNQHNHKAAGDSTAKKTSDSKPVVIVPTESNVTDTVKKSLSAIATGNINGNRLVIQYHSPAVRGRVIWGGLVPYDQVWVTGAHNATSFESPVDFTIGEKKIPAGKYAFFTIPGKEEWTIILNKDWDQHLADEYKQESDLVRLSIKPAEAKHQERLMYTIDQTGERRCVIEVRWEKVRVRVPLRLSN